ncbi:hypothetical protein GCM10010249_15380 [Streptomyces roseolilacinus]|uniref:Uncharacterized protein n=1 Tax=Streptomyces roseolilacinus TaxID=66904 RepID=A0A918EIL5_9ACTN|nr:hypothetical protein GCM10010249_15380 [Streptomyces roseolilacinus]
MRRELLRAAAARSVPAWLISGRSRWSPGRDSPPTRWTTGEPALLTPKQTPAFRALAARLEGTDGVEQS